MTRGAPHTGHGVVDICIVSQSLVGSPFGASPTQLSPKPPKSYLACAK